MKTFPAPFLVLGFWIFWCTLKMKVDGGLYALIHKRALISTFLNGFSHDWYGCSQSPPVATFQASVRMQNEDRMNFIGQVELLCLLLMRVRTCMNMLRDPMKKRSQQLQVAQNTGTENAITRPNRIF